MLTREEFIKGIFGYTDDASRWQPLLSSYPESERTPEVCMQCVNNPYDSSVLDFVPREFKTPELMQAAMATDGYRILDLPKNERSESLWACAVENSPELLGRLPDKDKTPEIISAALSSDFNLLDEVPYTFKTPQFFERTVSRNPEAIALVPQEHISEKMALEAASGWREALNHIPNTLITHQVVMASVRHDGRSLRNVPDEKRTPDVCQAAFEQNPACFGDIPPDLRTPEMAVAAYEDAYRLSNQGKEPAYVPYAPNLHRHTHPYFRANAVDLRKEPAVFICRTPEDAQAISKSSGRPVLICSNERKFNATVKFLTQNMPDKKIFAFGERGIDGPAQEVTTQLPKQVKRHSPPFNLTELKKGLKSYADFFGARGAKSLAVALVSQIGKEIAALCPGFRNDKSLGVMVGDPNRGRH